MSIPLPKPIIGNLSDFWYFNFGIVAYTCFHFYTWNVLLSCMCLLHTARHVFYVMVLWACFWLWSMTWGQVNFSMSSFKMALFRSFTFLECLKSWVFRLVLYQESNKKPQNFHIVWKWELNIYSKVMKLDAELLTPRDDAPTSPPPFLYLLLWKSPQVWQHWN